MIGHFPELSLVDGVCPTTWQMMGQGRAPQGWGGGEERPTAEGLTVTHLLSCFHHVSNYCSFHMSS